MAKAPAQRDSKRTEPTDAFLEIDAREYEEARQDPVVKQFAADADRLAEALERDVTQSS